MQTEGLPDGMRISGSVSERPDDGCMLHPNTFCTMHTDEQFRSIQEIHDLLADSRKDYKATAQRVDDQQVKQLLLRISSQRTALESELAQDLVQHDPRAKPGSGTMAGTIHRVALKFRDMLNNTSEVNVLVECERQELDLLRRYQKVLNSIDLNEASRATLARQYAEIERNLHEITETRQALESVEH